MSERRTVIRVAASRYRQATKKQKGHILDELVAVTGYHRFYAATLLKLQGRRLRIGQRRCVVGDLRLRTPPRKAASLYRQGREAVMPNLGDPGRPVREAPGSNPARGDPGA